MHKVSSPQTNKSPQLTKQQIKYSFDSIPLIFSKTLFYQSHPLNYHFLSFTYWQVVGLLTVSKIFIQEGLLGDKNMKLTGKMSVQTFDKKIQ